ncbi:hypothetical protein V8C86DRAFT_526972 [Haematococcus lacustris]
MLLACRRSAARPKMMVASFWVASLAAAVLSSVPDQWSRAAGHSSGLSGMASDAGGPDQLYVAVFLDESLPLGESLCHGSSGAPCVPAHAAGEPCGAASAHPTALPAARCRRDGAFDGRVGGQGVGWTPMSQVLHRSQPAQSRACFGCRLAHTCQL